MVVEEVFESQNIVQNTAVESWQHFFEVSFETQRKDLNLKWHFEKCRLSLKGGIWISNDILKSVIWDSKEPCESQMTFW